MRNTMNSWFSCEKSCIRSRVGPWSTILFSKHEFQHKQVTWLFREGSELKVASNKTEGFSGNQILRSDELKRPKVWQRGIGTLQRSRQNREYEATSHIKCFIHITTIFQNNWPPQERNGQTPSMSGLVHCREPETKWATSHSRDVWWDALAAHFSFRAHGKGQIFAFCPAN